MNHNMYHIFFKRILLLLPHRDVSSFSSMKAPFPMLSQALLVHSLCLLRLYLSPKGQNEEGSSVRGQGWAQRGRDSAR